MNYKRNRTQLYLESNIGVTDPEQLKNKKNDFENYSLNDFDLLKIQELLKDDASDYYYNGIISIAEGISSLIKRKYSWATIKLYYGVYYLLRATLGFNNYAILHNKGMYLLKIDKNEKPFKKNNKKYTTTHGATIHYYIDLFGAHDYLSSNTINEKNPYLWMCEVREIINYRCRSFMEPSFLDIWETIDSINNENNIKSIFENINSNPDIFCFQEEYAVMTIPIKRLLLTTSSIKDYNLLNKFGNLKMEYLKKILIFETMGINLYEILF